jgi:hypothetical protein
MIIFFMTRSKEKSDIFAETLHVFCLIEANLDQLIGWSGVSVLFASPSVLGLNDFIKFYSFQFFIPVWT